MRSLSTRRSSRQSSMAGTLWESSGASGSYLDLRISGPVSNDVVEETASNPSRSLLPMFDQVDDSLSADEVSAKTNSKIVVQSHVDSLNITSSSGSNLSNARLEKNSECAAHATLLSGVCAFVEVESSRASTVRSELRRMGATVLLRLTRSVTHFVFFNGRRKMLQKARQMSDLRIVSSLWVDRCFQFKRRVLEFDYPATLDEYSDDEDDDVAPSPVLYGSSKPGSKYKPIRFLVCRSVEEQMALSEKRLKEKNVREEERKHKKEIAAYDPYTPVQLLEGQDADTSGGSMCGLRPLPSDSSFAANSLVESTNNSIVADSLEPKSLVDGWKPKQRRTHSLRNCAEDTLLDTPLAERIQKRLDRNRRASCATETAPAAKRFQQKRPLSPIEGDRSTVEDSLSSGPTDSSISMGPININVGIGLPHRSRRNVAVNTSTVVNALPPSKVKVRRVSRRHTIGGIRCTPSPTNLLVSGVTRLRIGGVPAQANKDAPAEATNVAPSRKQTSKTPKKIAVPHQSSESPEMCSPFVDRAKKRAVVKRRRLGRDEMNRLYAETVGTPTDDAVRKALNESRCRGRRSGLYAVRTTSSVLNQLQHGLPSSEEFIQRTRPRIRQRKRLSHRLKPNVVLTSVDNNERNALLPIIKKLGGFDPSMQVDDSTSHVICKDRRRTMNLLKGVVRGCWVVSNEWVYRSLEAGEWLPEDDFEIKDWAPAIKRRRVSADEPSTLFASIGSFYIAPDCNPIPIELADLITRSGGKIASMPRASVLVLTHRTQLTDRFLENDAVNAVSEKWVLDSIMLDELQPFDRYTVL